MTDYKALTPVFTREQVAWAETHDWFICGNRYGILCRDEYSQRHPDGSITNHKQVVMIRGFKRLRNFAGY